MEDEKINAPRILATFCPQAWVNDYAIAVDPEGETEWDVTDHILATYSREEALALTDDSYETDELRFVATAPEWVKEWSGPFYVAVETSIDLYFAEPRPNA